MKDYIVIIGKIANTNTMSFERVINECRCDKISLNILINRGIVDKYDRKEGNVVMLSLKGQMLLNALNSVVDLAVLS